jgi:hypothetical protein
MGFDLSIDLFKELLIDIQFHKGIPEPADGRVVRKRTSQGESAELKEGDTVIEGIL